MFGLFVTLFASLIGLGLFMYGRAQRRPPQLGAGLALMLCPQFIDSPTTVILVTAGFVALTYGLIKIGA